MSVSSEKTPDRRAICVFAGSSPGSDPAFLEAASDLGAALVARGYGLVYGGASVGLMGRVADTVLAAGGRVVGVIPDFLAVKEVAHASLTELRITSSMHERKDTMASLADGFIALPGGFGTLEEFCEVITWAQLRLHAKPCGILNVNGYYDSLLSFLDKAVACRLLRPENRELVLVAPDASGLLDRMESRGAPGLTQWVDTART